MTACGTTMRQPDGGPDLVCASDADGPHVHVAADGTHFIGAIIGSHDVLVYQVAS